MIDTKVTDTPEARLHFLDYWRIIRIRKAVIMTVFLLVVLTTTVVTFVFLKETYSSMVRISVEKESPDVSGPFTANTPFASYDPFWLQTQFEKLQSHSVLDEVIRKLGLVQRWTQKYSPDSPLKPEETYMYLRESMKVRQSRNTSLIEITVYSEDKEEAAEIANAVAEVYKDSRLAQRREIKSGGIKVLQKHMDEMDLNVAHAKQIVDDMRRTNNITELGGENPLMGNFSTTLDVETLRNLNNMRVAADADYVQYHTLLEKITSLDRESLREALPTAMPVPDQQLVSLSQELTTFRQKLAASVQDYGKEHPEVKRVQSVVEQTEAQIDNRVDGIIQGLKTKVDSAKARLDNITAAVNEAETKQGELAAKYRPYFDKKRELEQLIQVRNALKLKIDQETIEATLPITTAVEIVDKAIAGLKPVKPRKTLNVILGAIGGLIIGVGLAFFIEYLDTSVKTIDDVERALQAPVLGVIPQNVGALLFEGPESPHAEAYRVLRTNILFTRKDESLNTMTVVSAGVGEGKSTTLLNLATIFAQNGDRVLVVDSDLRRPSLHKVLKVTNALGLTNYLLRQNTLEEVIQTSSMSGLDFLPSGKLPSSSMGILNSEQMKNLITELKRRYDFVFFDSPPIMGVSDASVLASEVDMTLQVIQYRRYPQPMTIRAKQMIQKVGGTLIGIVLNNINVSQDESYYYYSGYYHDYYYAPRNDDDDEESGKGKDSGKKSKDDEAKVEIKPKY